MPEEKTMRQCAAQGCNWCGYVLGYIGPHIEEVFPSQLLAAMQLAYRAGYHCKQSSVTEMTLARRITVAASHHKHPTSERAVSKTI